MLNFEKKCQYCEDYIMDDYKEHPPNEISSDIDFTKITSESEDESDDDSLDEEKCSNIIIQNYKNSTKIKALNTIKLHATHGCHLHQQTLISLFTISPYNSLIGSKARDIINDYLNANPEEIEQIEHPDFITLLHFFINSTSYHLQHLVLNIMIKCPEVRRSILDTDILSNLIEITFSPVGFSSNAFIGRIKFIIQLFEHEFIPVETTLFDKLIEFVTVMSSSFIEFYTTKKDAIYEKYNKIIKNQSALEFEETQSLMLAECDNYFNCGALQAAIDLVQTICVFNPEIYYNIGKLFAVISPFSSHLEKRNMTSLCSILSSAFDEGYKDINPDIIISLTSIFEANKRLLSIELSPTSISSICNLLYRILPIYPELWRSVIENGTAEVILGLFEEGASIKQAASVPFILVMMNPNSIEYTMSIIIEHESVARLASVLGMECVSDLRLEALEAIINMSIFLKSNGEWDDSPIKRQLQVSSSALEDLIDDIPDGIILEHFQELMENL